MLLSNFSYTISELAMTASIGVNFGIKLVALPRKCPPVAQLDPYRVAPSLHQFAKYTRSVSRRRALGNSRMERVSVRKRCHQPLAVTQIFPQEMCDETAI